MLWRGKRLSIKGKCFPTFVTTFTQYGRLNHIIFFFLFLVVVVVFCLMFCCYSISCLHRAFVSATLHGLSFRIFIYLPITVIILILLILEAVWLWTGDDWILCWHKLFYCRLLGKDGTLSFPYSKWHLGNYDLPIALNCKFKVMVSKQITNIFTKTELISKCRHRNIYRFCKYDTKDWRQLYCKKPLYCNFPFLNHIRLKIVVSIYLSIYLSTNLSIYLSICLSIYI